VSHPLPFGTQRITGSSGNCLCFSLGLVGWHSHVGFCKARVREGGKVRVREGGKVRRVREGGKVRARDLNDFNSCELTY
jgi:hypothetical protein